MRTKKSLRVTEELLRLGFEPGFSGVVGEQLGTDFTADRMLAYLRAAKPHSAEEVADEMLAILEFRDKCVEKHVLEGCRASREREHEWI